MKSFYTLVFIVLAIPAISQAITAEQRQQANAAFLATDWKQVIERYSAIAKAEPQNWNALMRWGIGLKNTNKVTEALPLLEEAQKIGNNPQTTFYLSSAYAKNKNADKAFEWLDKSITMGSAFLNLFEADEGFLSLKGDQRYSAFHERLKRNVYPCQFAAEARQFDFWVGDWDVKNSNGVTAGKSKIERVLGDCVILENWTSAMPNMYSGKSFNLYNSMTKKWMQTWVDDKGSVTEFVNGELKENVLTLETLPNAQKQVTRLSFHNLNPNLVRQHFEVSSDEGKTWKTTVDLYYHRIN